MALPGRDAAVAGLLGFAQQMMSQTMEIRPETLKEQTGAVAC